MNITPGELGKFLSNKDKIAEMIAKIQEMTKDIHELTDALADKKQMLANLQTELNDMCKAVGITIDFTNDAPVIDEVQEEVTQSVKKEEMVAPLLPDVNEISKVFEGNLSDFVNSFDETIAPAVEAEPQTPVIEAAPVAEQVPVTKAGERFSVKKTASAIIDEPAKALFGAAGIISKASETDKVETVDGIRDGLKSLYGKVVGDSPERVTEIEANIDMPLTKESSEELITGIEKCIKYYPKYKKEAAERKTAPVPDMAPGLEDDIHRSFESMDTSLNDLKSIDDILNGSRGM